MTEKEKRQCVHQRGKRKVSIYFDGRGIQNAIMRHIRREDTAYIVGCVAWLSNKRILKGMAENSRVCLLFVQRTVLQLGVRIKLRIQNYLAVFKVV